MGKPTARLKENRLVRRLTVAGSALYAIGVALLIFGFRQWGEQCWPLSLVIYLPLQIWLLPLAVFIPMAAIFEKRLFLIFAGLLLVVVFGAGFRFGAGARAAGPGARTIKVVTNNVGENNGTSVVPFVQAHDADLIVLQDIRKYRLSQIRRDYPDRFVSAVGEFALVSRWPIADAKHISGPIWRKPAAAVFRVEWPDQPVTVYSVHIPTARGDFRDLYKKKRRPGPGQRLARYQEAMRERVDCARDLARLIVSTPGPVIAAGDFNIPAWGYQYSLFSSVMTDAFAATGRGFGFTFPGFDPYLPDFLGPWLRLDYVFTNASWTPTSCLVEPDRDTQHRALMATLEWRP